MGEFVDDLTETYSHGMKQRTVFASALLHAPRVLVVDEPMIGLDPHSIRLVKDLLKREVAAGMCVLMSTHTLQAAEEIANRVGIMNHGSLLFDGTVELIARAISGREAVAGNDVLVAHRKQRQADEGHQAMSAGGLESECNDD